MNWKIISAFAIVKKDPAFYTFELSCHKTSKYVR